MLKKIIAFILGLNLIMIGCSVFAQQIVFTPFDNTLSNRGTETTISVGNGFLKWELSSSVDNSGNNVQTYYSADGESWRLITNDSNQTALRSFYDTNTNWVSCSAVDIGDYIVLSDKSVQFPLGMTWNRSSVIYVMDKNTFNIAKKCELDNPIGLTSYINGTFYVIAYTSFYSNDKDDMPYEEYRVATEQKTYCTTDFENWYEYSSDGSIPITNGKTTIYTRNSLVSAENGTNFYAQRNIDPQQVYTFNNNNKDSKIIYEAVDVAQIFPLRDLYIGIPSTHEESLKGKFLVSKDGVYFNIVNLPETDQNLYTMSEAKTDMLLCSINSYEKRYQNFEYMYCSYSELEQLAVESPTYVQLNDKILGFDQPPITENDRTLVPMRFLFEQMGAEVVWNDATQTATATVPVTTEEEIQTFGLAEEKSVTFSVDNTTATVNGSAATMDVPARLINDKTMVPLRFLSENLGFNVQWDEAIRTAIVTTE